jgi:dihydroorotate dehydrogenase electron transfer subunit
VIQSRCEVLSSRRSGAFVSVTLVAPEIAEQARPGQFIEVALPDERSSMLRRPFYVHQTSRRGGWAGTLEFVLEPRGPGSAWLAEVRPHQFLDVIGPLGRPFSYPRKPVNCLLVMEGYGAAPLLFLAEELIAQGQRVDMIMAAGSQDHVLKPIDAKRLSRIISVVTADGSAGEPGAATDVLEATVDRCGTQVVYAAGPRPLLRAVAEFCLERSIPAQVAVEEQIACGTGLCWGCVVPVARRDGKTYDHLRACVDGPAMNAARILWDRWGTSRPMPTPPEGFPPIQADEVLPTPPHGFPALRQ